MQKKLSLQALAFGALNSQSKHVNIFFAPPRKNVPTPIKITASNDAGKKIILGVIKKDPNRNAMLGLAYQKAFEGLKALESYRDQPFGIIVTINKDSVKKARAKYACARLSKKHT
ncbi:MAG: hypothetical protein KAS07_00515 [Candidatus Pacebacteria bacterium]|nr:hypothetical protein [Candidatus Paceibacterota bacterium]